MIAPLYWNEAARRVDLLDQTRLPVEEVWLPIETVEQMAEAICSLRVRGAPAIGIAAAYGVVLALREPVAHPHGAVGEAIERLEKTRPTAVNLFGALRRMQAVAAAHPEASQAALQVVLRDAAHALRREDEEAGWRIGTYGLSLLHDGMTVLTHCHAGGVATAGYGTALAPLLLSAERGVRLRAFVDETRPLLQGSRITAWELQRAGVEATLITDSMAGHVLQRGLVQAVLVGADRIAANGDVANKIGTYSLAVLAQAHSVPFYVFAPTSTIDLQTPTGAAIPIEERVSTEVTHGFGRQTAPEGIRVYNPAFDVTPAHLVTAIITEAGILRPPFEPGLRTVVEAVNHPPAPVVS